MARRKKKTKAQNGDGSFRIKPSGLIEYRFCYTDEYDQRQRKSVSGMTEQECLDKADEFLAGKAKLNKDLDANSSIVDILRYKYQLDYEKNFLSDAGYGRNLDSVKMIGKGPIGCMPIAFVEKKHIDMYSKTITHYSNSVIEKIFLQLKLAFSIAMEEGLISNNPMLSHSIRRPKSVKADKKVRGLSADEQKKLVDAMENKNPPKGRNDYSEKWGETNFTHIGTVTQVNPIRITHMTSPTAKIDSSIKGWSHFDTLPWVKQAEEEEFPAVWATVCAESGKTVKMRAKPSTLCRTYWDVPIGSEVVLTEPGDTWSGIIWNGRSGYMMTKFLQIGTDLPIYGVIINTGLTKAQAEELVRMYGGEITAG